jgi:hypothetical protein
MNRDLPPGTGGDVANVLTDEVARRSTIPLFRQPVRRNSCQSHSSSSRALASVKSSVSKPSVNQP